jgi:hypothetical protein
VVDNGATRKILPGEDAQALLRAYLVEARGNQELGLLGLKGYIIGVGVRSCICLWKLCQAYLLVFFRSPELCPGLSSSTQA